LIRLGTEAGSARTLISGKTKWVERLTDAVYAQSASCQQETDSRKLLQLRVLRLGLLQDGDVGVGVFPEREEILIELGPTTRPANVVWNAYSAMISTLAVANSVTRAYHADWLIVTGKERMTE